VHSYCLFFSGLLKTSNWKVCRFINSFSYLRLMSLNGRLNCMKKENKRAERWREKRLHTSYLTQPCIFIEGTNESKIQEYTYSFPSWSVFKWNHGELLCLFPVCAIVLHPAGTKGGRPYVNGSTKYYLLFPICVSFSCYLKCYLEVLFNS